ncbi:hypothetical protein RvY_18456-3 [Ramazzottius varieornatus]|uniref:BTB domain-containing protein n=1 Tax=Ramazzottius varieornatus TaxID=947166 RepID=A0A1D1WBA0_RAMVA|nr:hypothetical protein RvY_18456-3 [Ramazzottius varieornatus]
MDDTPITRFQNPFVVAGLSPAPCLWRAEREEENVVEISDVTPAAFQSLKTYTYSDAFPSVGLDNVKDVLVTSQKYLIGKLAASVTSLTRSV